MHYTFSLSRRSLPVRCLCLFLIVIVLLCFFLTPRAGAVALEAAATAYSAALVGAILVGAGVVFASHGDMQAVGAAMVKSWQQSNAAIGSKISALASWAVQHGEAAAKGALRVGKELYQAIVDAFNASYADGVYSVSGSSFSVGDYKSAEVAAALDDFFSAYPVGTIFRFDEPMDDHVYTIFAGTRMINDTYLKFVEGNSLGDLRFLGAGYSVKEGWRFGAAFRTSVSYGILRSDLGTLVVARNIIAANSVVTAVSAVSAVVGDLAYPSDDYLVKMPDLPAVDEVTGDVTYPTDAAYTKDAIAVPYPLDSEGVKVPDIPYDKVVDQSTGKTLDDTDTGTDTDKPGTDTETGGLLGQIIALLKNFFDSPSDFKLDFDGFKNLILPERFPFCIPFDMVKAVKLFAAAAADFAFSIDLDTQYFAVHHTVDLTPYVLPIAFFRYGCVIWFVWILISRTHDLIKW